jgi:hypothetical protein
MSFKENEVELEVEVEKQEGEEAEAEDNADATAFEKHIIQCCKQPEWQIRSWLRKTLTRAGFVIQEDAYKSDRCDKEKRYESVHNMLAIRQHEGEGFPKICLAAHTDVCRDHAETRGGGGSSRGEYYYWMYDRHGDDTTKPKVPRKVEPVIKVVEHEGKTRRVIQDKECRLQVGGDDRLGVAIITWIALNTGYDMALFFPTDEEIGLKSASACEMQDLKKFDLIAQVDRGNHSNELVIKINGEILVSYDTAVRLLEIAYNIGLPRSPVSGMGTDIYSIKKRGMCKEAVNMTCGYHNSHGSSSQEYIEISEAMDTMRYCSEIVKSYYIE